MNSTQNYEANGSDMAHECLDAIRNSRDQAAACCHLIGLLNNLSGCGEAENGARRGAAASLVNVIERGLAGFCADRVR